MTTRAVSSGPENRFPGKQNPEFQRWWGLLGELETSLRFSQAVLLTRDVARIEHLTEEQEGLRRRLTAGFPLSDSEFPLVGDAAMQALLERVLHLGRVQMVLLARAQRTLQMIAHLTAEPHFEYGHIAGRAPASAGQVSCRERGLPCRI